MDLLLKNGTVVTPDGVVRADLGTEGERIVYLGRPEAGGNVHPRETLDCSGCLLFPGAIDAHVQLEVSFGQGELGDDFYTGSRAAAGSSTECSPAPWKPPPTYAIRPIV